MTFEIEDIHGEDPDIQIQVLEELEQAIESGAIEDTEQIANRLLEAHENEIFTVRASAKLPNLLTALANSGAGAFFVQCILDNQYDRELLLDILVDSQFNNPREIEKIVVRHVQTGDIDSDYVLSLLENIDIEQIELPLNPYHGDQNEIRRAIKLINSSNSSIFEENLIAIYKRSVHGRLSSQVGNEALTYFTNIKSDKITPLIKDSIDRQLSEQDNRRVQLNKKELEALAAQGSDGIQVLIQTLRQLNHRDSRSSLLQSISTKTRDIDDESLDDLKRFLRQESLGHDSQSLLEEVIISSGDIDDLIEIIQGRELSDTRRYQEILLETIGQCRDNDKIIQFLSELNSDELVRNASDELVDVIKKNSVMGLYFLIQSDISDNILRLMQQRIVEELGEADEPALTSRIIDLLEQDIRPELMRVILQRRWSEAMPLLLDALIDTDRSSRIKRLQKPFKGLSSDEVEFSINTLIKEEELTDIEKETLRLGITAVDREEREYVQDRLVDVIDENIPNPRIREICLCIHRLRFDNNPDRLSSSKVAVLDRDAMPEPLPALRDLVKTKYDKNQMRSILTILEHLRSIESDVFPELMLFLPDEIEAEVNEYLESANNLSSFRDKSTELLINDGENVQVEFKHPAAEDEDIMKEIESMLNTQGGHLLIGVNDEGVAVGLSESKWDVDEPETRLQDLIEEYIRPEPVVDGHTEEVDNKEILRIDIPAGDMRPYFHRSNNSASEVRIRMGSKKIHANRRHIINLVVNDSWYETNTR